MDDADYIFLSLERPEEFTHIFDRHAEAIFGYLARRLAYDDAKGRLGEVFRVAFEARERFDTDRGNARPWLYGIASNLVRKHHRKDGRKRAATERFGHLAPVVIPFEDEVSQGVDVERLWPKRISEIDRLPKGDTEVLFLYVW